MPFNFKVLLLLLLTSTFSYSQDIKTPSCFIVSTTITCGSSSLTPGSGSVTSVSVTTANGVSGSVANPTTTPAITLTLGAITPSSINTVGQITSTLATGTAPLVIASTTLVPNLYVQRAVLADSATTNANLTGPITSVGNATSIASQTGTGSTFVVSVAPTITGAMVASGTLAIGGCTIGANALCLTGSTSISGNEGLGAAPRTAVANQTDFNLRDKATLTGYSSGTLDILKNAYFDGSVYKAINTQASARLGFASGGGFDFYNGPSVSAGATITFANIWSFNASGHLIAGTDNTYDIGASGATRPRNIFVGTNGTFGGTMGTACVAIASLPVAGTAGRRKCVNDQITACAAVGVAPTAGGAIVCPVFDNGTIWVGG